LVINGCSGGGAVHITVVECVTVTVAESVSATAARTKRLEQAHSQIIRRLGVAKSLRGH